MFTDKAQAIIDLAKDFAHAEHAEELTVPMVLAAAAEQPGTAFVFAECVGLTTELVRAACPEYRKPVHFGGKLALASSVHELLTRARDFAEAAPDHTHPGLINHRHLACALAGSKEVCEMLKVSPLKKDKALSLLLEWGEQEGASPRLQELAETMRRLRANLLAKVYGQDHAIHSFVEGLFNSEVTAAADVKRRTPRSTFVFAGPAGVGKTYLAELGAAILGRPYKRFDMSAYSGHEQNDGFIGMSKMWRGAHPGALTEFIEKNPSAVILLDEIEKAHLSTIHLFLQVLDAGVLQDKFHERDVSFREATIIFTTNAGHRLYDRPSLTGLRSANAVFHRQTILDALGNEMNPRTGEPYFPASICSRMAAGYPVLFNHLQINDLIRVVEAELGRVGGLFEQQYGKQFHFHKLISLCLVLREGDRADARILRSQAEMFVKAEVFNFCQLFKTDRLEEALDQIDQVRFIVDGEPTEFETDVKELFIPPQHPRILLIGDADLTDLYRDYITEVDWRTAHSPEEALEIVANEDIGFVLLDLWMGHDSNRNAPTLEYFDNVPPAARSLEQGQEILRKIRERLPSLPVFLLSLSSKPGEFCADGTADEELFLACLRAGGATGMITSKFLDGMVKGWKEQRLQLVRRLLETAHRLHREKAGACLGQQRKILTFDTAPTILSKEREVTVRLRNLRLSRAVAAADAGEILDEVERPRTRFDDVIGATTAKEELKFFLDYLKNTKRFAALGLKAPSGVLLYGPPGTGKTMLARAVAGESNLAFIPVSATSFVTMWQGSGPSNMRALFDRARRYAPAIVFIDEIDAIGKMRGGASGAGHGEEMALNALLTELDGFVSQSRERPVFVLAATNYSLHAGEPDESERSIRFLDPALVRRFSRIILVDLPETAARRQYLVLRLQNGKRGKVSEASIDLLAQKSAGMSISDLETMIESAGRMAIRKGTELTEEILNEALDSTREGEAKQCSPKYLERIARHEAGHTIVYWLSGWLSPEVSIIGRGHRGGGMLHREEEVRREILTRNEMLASIRVCLAGRAAEILYYGKDEGLSTGAAGDLEKATALARQMICRCGMDVDFGLLSLPHQENSDRVNEAIEKILKAEMAGTVALLQDKRIHLDKVVEALLTKNRLYQGDLASLLPPVGQRGRTESLS
jgi:ATP-dependent metalloprotease FtsH